MSAGALHRAVTLLIWTLVGVVKIAALVLLIGAQWGGAIIALAATVALVALALRWREASE